LATVTTTTLPDKPAGISTIRVAFGPIANWLARDSDERADTFKEPLIRAEGAFTALPDNRERVPFTVRAPRSVKLPSRVAEPTTTADVFTTPGEMVPVRIAGCPTVRTAMPVHTAFDGMRGTRLQLSPFVSATKMPRSPATTNRLSSTRNAPLRPYTNGGRTEGVLNPFVMLDEIRIESVVDPTATSTFPPSMIALGKDENALPATDAVQKCEQQKLSKQERIKPSVQTLPFELTWNCLKLGLEGLESPTLIHC
jgi:hypothetical protein